MPLATADLRPTTSDAPAGQDILGGSCPIAPMQICIIWAARQEKAISPLAFKVYFAAHEVKFWRCKTEPGESYHYQPYAFQLSDVGRLLTGVPAAKITRAFTELEAFNILHLSDSGIWFAKRLNDVTVTERVKHRAQIMFNQFHPDTRDKPVKIPRRLLKLLVECGRRIVRTATLLGILLTTMLTKRSKQYEGYKGCAKAKWIAAVFGVNTSRVKSERARWIEEGWFTREPTTPWARKKYGQWLRLNLTPSEPTPERVESPVLDTPTVQPLPNPGLSFSEESDDHQELIPEIPEVLEPDADQTQFPLIPAGTDSPKVQLQIPDCGTTIQPLPDPDLASFEEIDDHQKLIPEAPTIPQVLEPDADQTQLPILPAAPDRPKVQPLIPHFDPQVQPLLNPFLSSIEEIYSNQKLTSETPEPAAYQPQHPTKSTWTDIKPEDLKYDTRSEELRQEAIQRGYLKPTESDQVNFFAAIVHALRVAKTNACGLLRRVVENRLWHVISQADEYNGIARLKRVAEGHEAQKAQRTPDIPFLTRSAHETGPVDEQPIELSQDALIVQTITDDFQRARIKGNLFSVVQQHGHLQDWHQKRWEKAELELAQARLLRARQWHQGIGMTNVQDVMEAGADEDEPFLD